MLGKIFRLQENGTSVRTEIVAGITTFMTLSYIIFVQPIILSGEGCGMDKNAVFVATCVASALACFVMAFLANYPIALAPAMGHNVFFAIIVCRVMGYSWESALGAVFISGSLFVILAFFGLREKVMVIIPDSLKNAIAVGIGLLIALVGFEYGGIVVDTPGVFVGLGDMKSHEAQIAAFGTLVIAILIVVKFRGAILAGILATALLGWCLGSVEYHGIVERPPSLAPTLFKFAGIFKASPLLRAGDVKDLSSLASKLRDAHDPLSQYLRGQFSEETQRWLDDYDDSPLSRQIDLRQAIRIMRLDHPGDPNAQRLITALNNELRLSDLHYEERFRQILIKELNLLLQSDNLYDKQRFAQVTLTEETQRLIEQDPQGKGLVRLNRFLLEEAYPNEVAKSLFKQGALLSVITVIFVFFFLDLFDTVGTLVGVGQQAGLMKDGKLPRARQALLSDAIGTVVGAVLGTSTITSYVESAAGVQAGGRTGLTSVTTGLLMLLALFFSPLIKMVGGGPNGFHPVIAPALIIVGSMMLQNVRKIAWDDATEAIPAFLTLAIMPFTISITEGIAFGFISYSLLKLFSGRIKETHWLLHVFSVLFIIRYIFLAH